MKKIAYSSADVELNARVKILFELNDIIDLFEPHTNFPNHEDSFKEKSHIPERYIYLSMFSNIQNLYNRMNNSLNHLSETLKDL